MKYRLHHLIHADVETYWRLFFDETFNDALFLGHLSEERYVVQELIRNPDGSIRRRTEHVPRVDTPEFVRLLLGESPGFVEVGSYDPKAHRYTIDVVPRFTMRDGSTRTHLELWTEARGSTHCERIVEVDNEVKAFGVGGLVELFIRHQTRKAYDEFARFTNRWISDHGL